MSAVVPPKAGRRRRVEGSNLLELALTSFQDSRITVLPTLQSRLIIPANHANSEGKRIGEVEFYSAEEVGVEPTRRLRAAGLANLCLTVQPLLQQLHYTKETAQERF